MNKLLLFPSSQKKVVASSSISLNLFLMTPTKFKREIIYFTPIDTFKLTVSNVLLIAFTRSKILAQISVNRAVLKVSILLSSTLASFLRFFVSTID